MSLGGYRRLLATPIYFVYLRSAVDSGSSQSNNDWLWLYLLTVNELIFLI